jgi:4-amino-4-deoxy-L-arabinose transferase-like glycosyltransferase
MARFMVPLASVMGLLAFMSLIRNAYDEPTARLAGVGWVISPQILLLAGSYMSHITCLAWSLVAIWWTWRAWQRSSGLRQTVYAAGAGFMWMAAMINRPQDAVLAAGWLGMLALVHARPWSRWWGLMPGLLVGALPLVGWMLYRNMRLFGDALVLGYYPAPELLLFPMIKGSFGFTDTHTPGVALQYLVWSMYRLNFSLFGWPFSFVCLPLAAWDRAFRRANGWLVLAALIPVIFYGLHSYYGFEYEARYYVFMVPPLVVLSARGILRVMQSGPQCVSGKYLLAGILVLSVAYSLLSYWPVRVWNEYGHAYEQAGASLHRTVLDAVQLPALILVPSGNVHRDFRYSSGFIHNDPDLENPVIYARDLAGGLDCLMRSFPHRTFYRAHELDGRWSVERLDGGRAFPPP